MKKILLAISFSSFVLSCSSDDYTPATPKETEKPKEEAVVPNKPDEPKADDGNENPENTGDEENGDNTNSVVGKPDDFHMGNRSYASWKEDVDYIGGFDIETLLSGADNQKYDAAYFSQFIKIFSSSPNGNNFYTFQAEDFKDVEIKDLKFDIGRNVITFKTSYKGVKSEITSSLKFDLANFYDRKIKINEDFVASHYMRGIYEELGGFIGNLLNYDDEKYNLELAGSKNKDESNNSLGFSIRVTDKKDKYITTVYKNISGFRPLSSLQEELSIAPTYELREKIKEKIDRNKRNISLLELLKPSVNEWMKSADFYFNNTDLEWRGDHYSARGFLDLYIGSPRFELILATKEDNWLILKVKVVQINEVPTDLVYSLRVSIY
uniref:Or77 n=1 Tax=Ornithobacterium rhinotracheale TaxID=28251 RepID=A0A060IM94_ORNRH|nr:Or77 [Ornithobacterium rhinotracheale]AIC32817.1 Or77 [Ornithobacterium rhinotracheale]